MGEASGSEELSLSKRYGICEQVVEELENGTSSTIDLQERLKKCEQELKIISQEISALSLFNKNETVSELPTSSLQYFLVPSFLATVTQNIMGGPEERVIALDRTKIYIRDFLERLHSYEIIDYDLPWLREDSDEDRHSTKQKPKCDASQLRNEKIRRYQKQKEMQQNYEELKAQRALNADDDSLLRDLLLVRLRLAATKAMEELDHIEEERPLAERMAMMSKGQIQPQPRKPPPQKQVPFIITRDKLQKEVFGLGYPSVPTVTVNEWCDDMMKHGRFHPPENSEAKVAEPASDEESETAEEARRAHSQRWDEYKDDHRRGWGNTHNKG